MKAFRIHTTISGEEIKVVSNQRERTFTIQTSAARYRTYQFEQDEFDRAELHWTGNDWKEFLKTDEYYKVK